MRTLLPRLERALWTWRLSGKAGGTGTGWAVEAKTRGIPPGGPRPRQNLRLDDYTMQASRNRRVLLASDYVRGPRVRDNPALHHVVKR